MGQPNKELWHNPIQVFFFKKKKKTRSLSELTQKHNPLKAAHPELKTLGFLWGLEA